ncbi:DNA N-6-adenine-methyltransferase [Sphingomonas sp. CD22]|uniref:DNA N-6-adenine-methyltransferase n=1 Tax=Sphingomonas sp. CD22 TaxID=3100214 RepID=UPI002ADF3567|nr:DNA N-6-adenine-methyltransferase [Sphingomonas sp. CD22]MEA1086461.1 DNA N-6-adenine-methyltransferase [Sphingomonas sp. CD22]
MENDARNPKHGVAGDPANNGGLSPLAKVEAASGRALVAGPGGRVGKGGRLLAETSLPGLIEHYESDDRFTSPALILAIEESFGRIQLDPCWHEASSVRPVHHFDVRQGHDGLRDEWFGSFAFVNPPWSAQDDWVRRGHDQWLRGNVRKVVFLVPAATGAVFFHEALAGDAAIFLFRGRPSFSKVGGTEEGTMVNVMLVALGATVDDRRRLAERVRGSWWRPEQLPAVIVGKTQRVTGAASWTLASISCVAGKGRAVTCGPPLALEQG